ncbi:MAG: hypothetical protein KAI64_02865, partial [Thermoplasmata archaeon]|nr:hypothetical protein [Thermoplasmata archaeon]
MTEVIEENKPKLGNGIIEPMVSAIGVGGAGSNIVNALKAHVDRIETVAINTDAQHLFKLDTDKKILIGRDVTRGLGARFPEVGAYVAENSIKDINDALQSDIIVIVTGLGGGTGTGAAPLIADLAKEKAITIVVAIMPFTHEGEERRKVAEDGLKNLRGTLESVMVLENDTLLKFSELKLSEALLEIPRKLIANIIKGVVEQVSMSLITTLEEELVGLFNEGDETALIDYPRPETHEIVAPVQF